MVNKYNKKKERWGGKKIKNHKYKKKI